MRRLAISFTIAFAYLLQSTTAGAGSLQVSPTTIDVPAPGATARVTLRNSGQAPLSVQVRVFRWSQVGGEEKLDPTSDVVASPPIMKLAPGTDYAVRIVRATRNPVGSEESYRLLVDELPDPVNRPKSNGITFLMRHSLPVFFGQPNRGEPRLAWSIRREGEKLVLRAENAGQRRVRLSDLRLRDGAGQTVVVHGGLAGYVLGNSSRQWVAAPQGRAFGQGGASITAQSDIGPIDAKVPVR